MTAPRAVGIVVNTSSHWERVRREQGDAVDWWHFTQFHGRPLGLDVPSGDLASVF